LHRLRLLDDLLELADRQRALAILWSLLNDDLRLEFAPENLRGLGLVEDEFLFDILVHLARRHAGEPEREQIEPQAVDLLWPAGRLNLQWHKPGAQDRMVLNPAALRPPRQPQVFTQTCEQNKGRAIGLLNSDDLIAVE